MFRSFTARAAVGFFVFATASALATAGPVAEAASSNSSASTSAKRTCDASLLPDCTALANAPLDASHSAAKLGFPTPRDGGAIFNGQAYMSMIGSKDPAKRKALADQQSKLMDYSPAREKRAQAIAERVRAAAIDIVSKGEQQSAWTAEQALLIQRLKTVQIDTVSNPPSVCSETSVPRGFPNAGYDDSTHTLYLCAPTLNVTEAQLIHTLGHEFGHVASPCMEESTLYKTDTDQLYRGPMAECEPRFFYDEEGNPAESYDDTVSVLVGLKPPYVVARGKPALFAKLESCGILKAVPASTVPSPKLYAKTMTCLSTTYGKEYTKYVDDEAGKQSVARGIPIDTAKARVRSDVPAVCMRIAEETFADSFEASVLGKIASESGWTPADYQVALLEKRGFACYEQAHDKVTTGDYPRAGYRVETILNDPRTADRLSCERPKDPKLCPIEISTSGASGNGKGRGSGPNAPHVLQPARSVK